MKKSVLMFSLLSGTALMFPRLTIASGLPAHTLAYTPEPRPAFQFEQLDKAYKTAGVCFLGVGDCGGAAGYDSSSSGTCSAKENGTGASCGGRYESCVCKPEYQYTSSNCSYPRSVSGDSCGGQYTDCVCPAGVDEGPYGCAEYYPSPCSSVCKVAYSDNCHIRSDDPNTALGYGCMKKWDDCSTKCERAYTDMCRERTAVISSCPANATCSYFSDCSSKIQSWSCISGYKQLGSSCIKNDPPCPSDYRAEGAWFPRCTSYDSCTSGGRRYHKCYFCRGDRAGTPCGCGGSHKSTMSAHSC